LRRRVPVALLTAVPVALGLGACGNERTKPPDVTAIRPANVFVASAFPDAGIALERPSTWLVEKGAAPLVATITSGRVTIAIWRYPRNEPLPETPEQLDAAKDVLVAAAQARDTTLKVTQAKGTRAARSPAVVIVADETVAGQPRRVRSTHVYAHGGEIVVDAFAPPGDYAKVEDPVFRRIVRSLRLSVPTA